MNYIAIKPSSNFSVSVINTFAHHNVKFIVFPFFKFKSYSNSNIISELALNSSIKVPNNIFIRYLKKAYLKWQYNWSRHYFNNHPDVTALCWNGLNSSRYVFMQAAKDAGVKTIFFELAPLPGRITIDPQGVNFRNSLPRNIDFYLNWNKTNLNQNAWVITRESIKARASSKNKNVKQIKRAIADHGKPFLFVPLQVQNDSQLRLFSGLIESTNHFIESLAHYSICLPEGWTIRVKEHPTSSIPYHLNEILSKFINHKIIIDNETDTIDLIKDSEGVITINSSVGLESFYYEKPVLILGQAFYNIKNITNSINAIEDLENIFSNPKDSLYYDQDSRIAFLNYLDCVYYPKITLKDGVAIDIISTQN